MLLLAADEADAPITKDLVTHPDVAIVDFTGSPAFGAWVREHAATDLVFTEEAGINPIVIDSTNDFRGMCGNIAFSLSLYSGQMCTAPQNIFVPAGGIATNDGHKSFDEVAAGIATAIDKLLGDPERAAGILGAVQNEATLARVAAARKLGRVVRDSATVAGRPASPMRARRARCVLAVDAADEAAWGEERFGPISFIVKTASTAQLDRARRGIDQAQGRHHRLALLDRRHGDRRGRRRLRPRRRGALGQSHRRHLRQPVRRLLATITSPAPIPPAMPVSPTRPSSPTASASPRFAANARRERPHPRRSNAVTQGRIPMTTLRKSSARLMAAAAFFVAASAAHAEIKIGAMLSVTGPASFLGDPEKKTLEMYVADINAKGGVNGQKIKLFVYDDGGDPEPGAHLRHARARAGRRRRAARRLDHRHHHGADPARRRRQRALHQFRRRGAGRVARSRSGSSRRRIPT